MSTLQVQNMSARYGQVQVLHDISIEVAQGQLVALLGLNGAGKSTVLRTISGITSMVSGKVLLDGKELSRLKPEARAAAGIAHVPENRRTFRALSIEDNLQLGGYVSRKSSDYKQQMQAAFDSFPILGERKKHLAGSLSGGQQQMLAIAMAMMAKPKVLMLDEPSLGLAPLIVDEVYRSIETLQQSGLTILLVEQMGEIALDVADYAVVLDRGSVVGRGTPEYLRPKLAELYLGSQVAHEK